MNIPEPSELVKKRGTVAYSVRLNKQVYDDFKNLCENAGVPMSKTLAGLMKYYVQQITEQKK